MNIDNISKSLNQTIDDKISDNIKLGEALNDLEYEGVEESILTTLNNKQNKSDNSLATTDKTIVGAINELFQNVDSGKQLIASAIDDESITKDSTFEAMGEAITRLKELADNGNDLIKQALVQLMKKNGYIVTEELEINELIDMLEYSNISLEEIKKIDCCEACTAVLKKDGTLWVTKYDSELAVDANTFIQMENATDVKDMACGGNHIVIIKNDGTVWSYGYNYSGQLGLGDKTDRDVFTQVAIDVSVDKVFCGYNQTYIIVGDTTYACGENTYSQLGTGGESDVNTFTTVKYRYLGSSGYQFESLLNIKSIAIGENHALALTEDGSVYFVGYNQYGSAGGAIDKGMSIANFVEMTSDAIEIACSKQGSYVVKSDGSLWVCGYNNTKQLGLEDTSNILTLTQAESDVKKIVTSAGSSNNAAIIKNDNSLWISGVCGYGQSGTSIDGTARVFTKVEVTEFSFVEQVAMGQYYTMVVDTNKTLWGSGYNHRGQLGFIGTTSQETVLEETFKTIDVPNSPIDESSYTEEELRQLKLYNLLLKNNFEVTEDMTIDTMLNILTSSNDKEDEIDSREVLYNMMIEDGYNEATSEMTVDELIELLDDSQIEIGEVKQIACGDSYTFILKIDGSIWCCGDNDYGQLGLNDTTKRTIFTQVTTNINNDAKQIVCGYKCTFILKNDGSLWGCGYNYYGQLGLGDTTDRSSFTQVTNDVKQIACGDSYTIILKTDGSVWACGYNGYGQLGLGDTTYRTSFTQITTNINNDVSQIACGYYHTIILKNNGSVYACGRNNYGELGLNDTTQRTTFTQVTTNISEIKQIACGNYHTFILKNDGSIWSCGRNNYGQLGWGTSDSNTHSTFIQVTTNINNDVKQVSTSGSHTFILKKDGSAWTCGYNYSGQLGLNDNTNRTTFTQVTTNISNDVRQIACGNYHTFILKNNGSVWSCGNNGYGQLGLGTSDTDIHSTFTQVSTFESVEIDESELNRLKLYYYLLDNSIDVTDDMNIDTMLDILIASNNNAISKIENTRSTLAGLMQEGGYDITGDEDIDSLLDLLILSGISVIDIKQISCGDTHTFILKNDASLWSCGYNNYGQLGLGDTDNRTTFTQVTENINNDVKQIVCGQYHTYIIKNDGSIWACGRSNYGQLGLGDTDNRTTFTQVTTNINNDVKKIICGYQYTFIIKTDDSVWSCGRNTNGQLGLGDTTDRTTFMQVTTNISDVKQIACGWSHTFIIKNDGSIWSCGHNGYGQLGLGDTTNRTTFTQVTTNISDVKQIICGYTYTFILKNDGSVWGCGLNSNGQLGLGDTDDRTIFTQVTTNINNDVKQIVCGGYHTFILKTDGSVWCCGWNYYGQLGLGTSDTDAHTTFTQVTTNIDNDVKQIACGTYHTFIIKTNGSVWACGRNNYGQLGLGDSTDRTTFTIIPRGL